MTGQIQAKDCKCNKCGKSAVAFWPCVDPDIRSFPWCQKCLDEERNTLLVEMYKEGLI